MKQPSRRCSKDYRSHRQELWKRFNGGNQDTFVTIVLCGDILHTYTLLTTTANHLVKPVHDRLPVILTEDAAQQWLTCKPETVAQRLELLKPFPAEQMEAYEASPIVNSSKTDAPECVKPVGAKILLEPYVLRTDIL